MEDADRGVDLVDVGDGGFVEGLGVSVSSTTWMGWGLGGGYLIAGFLGGSLEMGFFAHLGGLDGGDRERCFVNDCKQPWELGVLLKKGGRWGCNGRSLSWCKHPGTKNKIKYMKEFSRLGVPRDLFHTERTNTVAAGWNLTTITLLCRSARGPADRCLWFTSSPGVMPWEPGLSGALLCGGPRRN